MCNTVRMSQDSRQMAYGENITSWYPMVFYDQYQMFVGICFAQSFGEINAIFGFSSGK